MLPTNLVVLLWFYHCCASTYWTMCWKWCMQSYSIFISLMLILILKDIKFINKKWVYQNLRLRLNKLLVPQKQWPWKFSLKDCISMKSGSEKQIYSWSSYAKALKVFNSIGHLWRTDPKELYSPVLTLSMNLNLNHHYW